MSDNAIYLGQFDEFDWEELPQGEEVIEVEYYPKSLTVGLSVAQSVWRDLRYQMAYAFVMQVVFDLKTGSGIYRSNGELLSCLDEVVRAALEDRLDGQEYGLSPVSIVAQAYFQREVVMRYLNDLRSGE